MIAPLTPNTQAILLLTAPLNAGRNDSSAELLTFGEYNRIARMIGDQQKQPADLIGSDAGDVIDWCAKAFGRARLDALLGRGFLLSQAVERWNARAIWVVGRADEMYPRRFKTRLKEDAPPLLYGSGDAALLETGGLAVVGSPHVDDELIAYTERVGRMAAEARRTLISGAARGIDRAAMSGALQAGGTVAGVMSESLERAAVAGENREPLMDQRLVWFRLTTRLRVSTSATPCNATSSFTRYQMRRWWCRLTFRKAALGREPSSNWNACILCRSSCAMETTAARATAPSSNGAGGPGRNLTVAAT
jgi:hypothetical protein